MPAQDTIREAASNRRLVEFMYPDKEGGYSRRLTEPYEIKNGHFFGYDVDKHGIRQYRLDAISEVRMVDESYEPRWPVKLP